MKKLIKYFIFLVFKMIRDFKGNIVLRYYLYFWDVIIRYDSVIEEFCYYAVDFFIGNTISSICNLYLIYIC